MDFRDKLKHRIFGAPDDPVEELSEDDFTDLIISFFVAEGWRWLPVVYRTGAEWQKKFLEALDKEKFLMGVDKDMVIRVASKIK